jgi:hypothetical protein
LTLTLNKSIGATHLNKKTGVPWSEPEANIPFGAIIQYVGSDGGKEKFTYMGELYRCPADVLASALDGGKIPRTEPAAPAVAKREAGPAANPLPPPALMFEPLSAGTYAIARAKITGGWLIALNGTGLTFYPDVEHVWNGESVD